MIESTYLRQSSSWAEFSSSLNSLIDKNKKLQAGKIYEKCVQLFLQTDPKYQAALKNVWLLQDVPKSVREKLKLPNADEGIDLIAETNQKKYWAIQAKYKSDKTSTLTRKDLATFRDLAFNYCNNIQHGLVCSPISHEPKKSNLMNNMGFALINEWEDLDKDNHKGWKNIQKKLGGKTVKPEKFKPKPHQSKAIKEVIKAFKSNSVERGKMIMPCGTGKSLTAFWITRDMKVKNVLVAIPSLSLLQQTLNVWTKEFLANDIQPDYLCVCSDESAGSLEKDEFTAQTYDLGIRTTTDVDEISSFLKDKNSKFKIIFTTYQSGQATAKASKKAKFTFDLGIMDEAHKTVGHKLKPMAHLLSEKNIKIKKRLFMTATERVYKGGKENEILSMDDPQDYGNTVYQMTYKEAIDAGVVSDYKIVSFNVTDAEYREIIQNNEYIRLNNNPKQNDDVTARELATALALRKTFKKLKISKALSFHSSIRRADKFEILNQQISKDFKKYPSIETYHVSSKQNAGDRLQEMRSFEHSNKSLMTNARCLTEGVDVPAIDCVAFIDSKRSKVDIVQAAGRAMRISKGKKYGYILVPVITNSGDINSASIDTEYEDLIAVITSLATQDERLIDEIKSLSRKAISTKRKTSIIDTKINSLKKISIKKIDEFIGIKTWNRISILGYANFDEARDYVRKIGLKNQMAWREFASSSEKPIDIPANPWIVYKNIGWVSLGDFLGTNTIANIGREYLPFKEAREYTRSLKLKNIKEWKLFYKKYNPEKLGSKLDFIYKNEFISWADMLNYEPKGSSIKFVSYEEAKKLALKNKVISKKEWSNFYRKYSTKYKIPTSPMRSYKNEWTGWGDFLGTGYVATFNRKYVSFEEFKKTVRKKLIKSASEYSKLKKNNLLEKNFPSSPERQYKNEWSSWGEILNTGRVANQNREYLEFSVAKKIVNNLNLKSQKDFTSLNRDYLISNKIPLNPEKIYKNKGWKNWKVWIGDNYDPYESFRKNEFWDFKKAKNFVKKLNIKNAAEWSKFTKSSKFPKGKLRTNPYKYSDFMGFEDFLGKKKKY